MHRSRHIFEPSSGTNNNSTPTNSSKDMTSPSKETENKTFVLDPCTEMWANTLRSDQTPDFFGHARFHRKDGSNLGNDKNNNNRPKTAPGTRSISNVQMQQLTDRLMRPTISTAKKLRNRAENNSNSNSENTQSISHRSASADPKSKAFTKTNSRSKISNQNKINNNNSKKPICRPQTAMPASKPKKVIEKSKSKPMNFAQQRKAHDENMVENERVKAQKPVGNRIPTQKPKIKNNADITPVQSTAENSETSGAKMLLPGESLAASSLSQTFKVSYSEQTINSELEVEENTQEENTPVPEQEFPNKNDEKTISSEQEMEQISIKVTEASIEKIEQTPVLEVNLKDVANQVHVQKSIEEAVIDENNDNFELSSNNSTT